MTDGSTPADLAPDGELTDDDLDQRILAEHQSIPQATRDRALDRDAHRCRIDGRRDTDEGGTARLIVQRLQERPHTEQPDNLANVTTCCLRCARWIRQMPSSDDLPRPLQARLDTADLKTTRVQILQYLYRHGPATTSDITDNVDLATTTSVRRALYDLMSRDVRSDGVERLLVKDRVTGTYGLPTQIPADHDARGVIPLEPHRRRSRILDALADRLLDALTDRVETPRAVVADIVDRDVNQTYHMQRRAQAFQFPFETWAETKRARRDAAAASEAISVFAAATSTLSRQRVAAPLVDLLKRNEEHELAAVLGQSLLDETDPSFDALAGQPPAEATTERSPATGDSDQTDLQVLDNLDGTDRDTTDGASTSGPAGGRSDR
jgi:hypothetical protein